MNIIVDDIDYTPEYKYEMEVKLNKTSYDVEHIIKKQYESELLKLILFNLILVLAAFLSILLCLLYKKRAEFRKYEQILASRTNNKQVDGVHEIHS